MCYRILSLVAKIYPFNSKISRSLYLKINFLFALVLAILFFNENIDRVYKLTLFPVIILIYFPIGIYQHLNGNFFEKSSFVSFIHCSSLFLLLIIVFNSFQN